MRRVALIYNPMSGMNHGGRMSVIDKVVAVFRDADIEVRAIATEGPGSAGRIAQEAIADGCDTVIACGGDGTVHEALQQMVGGLGTLGVIPMGTANALAIDLGLPSSPVKAAKRLLSAVPERVSVGRVSYMDSAGKPCSRYFVVAAGIGADGLFFSRLDSKLKHRFGYAAYLVAALRMAFTHTFPLFRAKFTPTGTDGVETAEVSQILAVRISNFGGMVNRLAPGAAIENKNLHVLAFKTRSRLRYMRFMVAVWIQRHTYSYPIELVDCSTVECSDLEDATVPSYVEADGELLGTLPVRLEVVPTALTLLIPQK
ncbi:MAG: diacylglycerol kinase family lipid kinase [Acidobacteriota bacterium]|nr:diacylglycerol kinase family lipid kinase [Acidobacteriota bacterium]